MKMMKNTYLEKKKLCKKYPKKYTMEMCLAKKKSSGGKCRRCVRKAMFNGRCKLHGGMSTGSGHFETGKYSKYFKDKMLEKYEYFRRDPKILELKDELAIMRALVAEAREFMDSSKIRKKAKLQYILREQMSRLVDMVGRNIERVHKIRGAVVSIEAIPIVIKQLVNIIAESLSVCPHCKADLRASQRDMYSKMLTLRLPTIEWSKNSQNEMLEAEYKVVTDAK